MRNGLYLLYFFASPEARQACVQLCLPGTKPAAARRVEPLARLGAQVTGIDAVEKSIHIARLHAALDDVVASRVEYRAVTAEALVAEGASFDAVLSLEVCKLYINFYFIFVAR